ncbi:MAG: hypothetical protein N4A37_05815 [Prolixibacteraceae bacterium]|nr:hypothetical protein [Prolixibacteraceae bacterium]
MVCPWFVHGLSIDLGVFDGGTMEQPWTNHGGSTFETCFNSVCFFAERGHGVIHGVKNRK